eukprot:2491053-Alexandrium_andersonii.AAC.1
MLAVAASAPRAMPSEALVACRPLRGPSGPGPRCFVLGLQVLACVSHAWAHSAVAPVFPACLRSVLRRWCERALPRDSWLCSFCPGLSEADAVIV